jgi:hypothetical protein
MSKRLLVSGLLALGVAATAIASAGAQPFTEARAGAVIQKAGALAARIRAYHRGPGIWTGATPPPVSYCPDMREGERVIKELAYLSSKAILYRQPGLALRLQHAGDALSDELDEEEEINNAVDIPYQVFPCPVLGAAYPARAAVIGFVERRMSFCRVEANALRNSFEARRALMQQCLRLRQ